MPETVNVIVPVKRMSPKGEHCFFGYYDIPAADEAGRHLCHRVQFRDRLPRRGDVAELGWLALPGNADAEPDGIFHPIAETEAWNFQQSSMAQWLASEPDTCLFNTFEHEAYGSRIHDIRTGRGRLLPLPVANVSRDGTKALCINMSRLFDFRPGYGYEELPDPFADVAQPRDDGVRLMDIRTGNNRLILSLADIVEFLEQSGERIGGKKVLINHITFNPSATRFLLLLRTFPEPGTRWETFLVTSDLEGRNLRHHNVWGIASHYHWRDDDGMLFYMNVSGPNTLELALVSDSTGSIECIDTAYFRYDGHCSYSPDLRWILYDSYVDSSTPDFLRNLQVYSLDRREGILLGRFRAGPLTPDNNDLRCDLHPRWMPGGTAVTFDSIHEGFRGIYWADLIGVVGR
ncbi:MAG TPA: hypothetical protein PLG27_07405 [Candidatus Latescibacteria bacterium]|nr:hypothetical protein [Candidatus Latescibacterota bacterium]